jgi:glucose/mannose transport system substrate-binding protein
MAAPSVTEGALKDVVSQFWNSDKLSVKEAMEKLAAAGRVK